MKILVAEDEYTTRMMVQVCLENWGYSVESVADGKAAWHILSGKKPPEIAILDWEMPEINGMELCRKIKSMDRNTPIHVIMLTARDSKTDITQGFDAGADDYITKPFNDDELRARIRVAERIVTIQSSLDSSLQELKEALDLVEAFDEPVVICEKCRKIEGYDGSWKDSHDLLKYPVDPRFVQVDCPACKNGS